MERDLENRTKELLDTQQSLHMAEELRKVAQKDVASLEIMIRSLEEQLSDLQVVFDSADAKRLAVFELLFIFKPLLTMSLIFFVIPSWKKRRLVYWDLILHWSRRLQFLKSKLRK